ncbi:MAG: acyl-CoA thioesterase [Dehalococcoidia bacterium]|nr:acyl-CoA thioesterase [Dehalococcoidia bacterium]
MTADEFRFRCRIRVRWAECDAQGIVFNGAYFSYLEVGMAAYYRNLGIALYDPEGRRHFDTATVKATLEYISPALVDDVLDLYWRVDRIGNSSIATRTEIYNSRSGDLVLKAEVIHVDYDSDAGTSRPVPDDLRRLIETYEATGEIIPLDDLPGLRGVARSPEGPDMPVDV